MPSARGSRRRPSPSWHVGQLLPPSLPATLKGQNDWAGEPVGYARQVLGVRTLTSDQQAILRHLELPPRKVLVPSGHDTGKTFVAAVALNYWFDTYDPGVVISTAPTAQSVRELLWAEVRLQRQRAGLTNLFTGPRACELYTSEEHWCRGYTTESGDSFQGRHRRRLLFLFDEATGVAPEYWTVAKTMFDASLENAWLAIFNPTDSTSQAYQEDGQAVDDDGRVRWHRFQLSALNHPNIAAQLAGRPKPVPAAVSVEMVNDWVREWCEPVRPQDREATDLEWPPASGQWYRPGPIMQARGLGLWPDAGAGVWSDALWQACFGPQPPYPLDHLPEVGCDCSTGKGDDYHAIHARWGAVSFHHETSNTMDAARIYDRLRDVAARMALLASSHRPRQAEPVRAEQVRIKVDDDGTGGAVAAFLRRAGLDVVQVGAGCSADDADGYPRKRDELWFQVAGRARLGRVHLGLLDRATRRRLKAQLMAPEWKLDPAGRRCVEKKEDTKLKLGRSPDDADAFNLAYLLSPAGGPKAHEAPPRAGRQTGGRR